MSLDFFKNPLKGYFGGCVEQEAPSVITANHAWLDALVEHPPTPDEPPQEFADYFACVEEAVRARSYVPLRPDGRARANAPLYTLDDKAAAEKAEAIFRFVFEHEGWSEQGRQAMDEAWRTVPGSLMKLSFPHNGGLYTPATIYRTAQSQQVTAPQSRSAALYSLDDYRHPSADNDGEAELVAATHEASL